MGSRNSTSKNASNADKVKQFTEESRSMTVPNQPFALSREEVEILAKNQISEIVELLQTVMDTDDAIDFVKENVITDINRDAHLTNNLTRRIADQVDACIDLLYYTYNFLSLSGINLDKYFDIVHKANLAKRDPATGNFIRRNDGKILKPPGWVPPDKLLQEAIERDLEESSSWI